MQRNFSAVPHGERRSRKRLVRNCFPDHIVCRLQLRFAAHIHRPHRHGIRRQLDSKFGLQIHAGNRDRQMPAHGNLSKQRARHGNLRDVADAKRRQPSLRLRKSLDQVRTPESQRDHRLACFVICSASAACSAGTSTFPLRSLTRTNSARIATSYESAAGNFSVSAFTNRVSARNAVSESKRLRSSRSRSSPGYGSGSAYTETSSARIGFVPSSGSRRAESRSSVTPRSEISCAAACHTTL